MTSKLAAHGFEFRSWPGGEAASEQFGLSHVVILPPNARRIIVGGQVGIKDDGSVPEDLEEECKEALRHVLLSLKAAGLGDDALEYVYSVCSHPCTKGLGHHCLQTADTWYRR